MSSSLTRARSNLPRWPTLSRERELGGRVCGIDEAGYAPLAGPVVAAAVVLPRGPKPRALRGLTDSKLLSPDARARFFDVIQRIADVGVGMATVDEIDRLNIFHSNMLAMKRALDSLGDLPDFALVDGRALPPLACRARALVKGDRRSLSIAAASVIAKVVRDRLMHELARSHPGYGWETNVGYGTDEHYLGLLRKGPTEHHRRSFAPLTTIFAVGSSAGARFRFRPISGEPDLSGLDLLRLRQDLFAVFEGGGHHIGALKNQRGQWIFRSVGYGDDLEPLQGGGPFAAHHGRELAHPGRQALIRLLADVSQ